MTLFNIRIREADHQSFVPVFRYEVTITHILQQKSGSDTWPVRVGGVLTVIERTCYGGKFLLI